MSRDRITDRDVARELRRFTEALRTARGDNNVTVVLHRGNREYRVTNKLVLTLPRHDDKGRPTGGTVTHQVWPDASAGYTGREAYNALRLMTAALALTED